jgi:leader peptidase (prepilin peptidase)/N-methyltransferase
VDGAGWTTIGWACLAAVLGAVAGWGLRLLLGRLRRGAVIRPGVLEVVTAVVSAAGVQLAFGRPQLGLVLWAGVLGIGLSAVDLEHHRLPDALTLPAIPISLAAVALTDWLAPASGDMLRAVAGGAVLGAAFGLLALLTPRNMGWGDVKLVISVGVLLGFVSWSAVLLGLVVAFVLGAVVSIAGIVVRRWNLKSAIPFGPFLLAGCWLVLVLPASTVNAVL